MFLTWRPIALPRRGGALLLAAAAFAAGLSTGELIAPVAASPGNGPMTMIEARPSAPASVLRSGHPAEAMRVLDGDTFEARVHIWPGVEITTRVRLRGIDAPELRARCDSEQAKALAAREGLARLLAQGAVGISRVGQDKFGGRVDADVSTAVTPDVSAAMLQGGYARPYSGGRRESWCG